MSKSYVYSFIFMFLVYLLTMGLYYNQTHRIIIDDTEKSIQGMLLSQRALSHLVSDVQKREVFRLQSQKVLDKEYFSSALLSSSYVAVKLNEYTNRERKKLGLEPIHFRYASPNPTNPENLASIEELAIYQKFQDSKIQTHKQIIEEDNANYLYYAIAGKVMTGQCMQCHGDPADAPREMIEQYGENNGFGYKTGELSSIISIKMPLADVFKENDSKFYLIAFIVFIVFLVLFVLSEVIRHQLRKKQREITKALESQEKSYQKTKELENSLSNLSGHLVSLQFDVHGKIITVSKALCELSAYSQAELLGQNFCHFRHPDISDIFISEIWKCLVNGKEWKGEIKCLSKEGELFWVESTISPIKDEHNITYAFESIMRVITEQKALLEDINIDPLTSLLNRRSFEQHFQEERTRAKRDKKYFSLVMLDIDYFKRYNDTYGHLEGDTALKDVATALHEVFRRSSDLIFRMGGEEFAVIHSGFDPEQLISVTQNACQHVLALQIPHEQGVCDYLSISIGMTIVQPDAQLNMDTIYELSDRALYMAKEKGRNRLEVRHL